MLQVEGYKMFQGIMHIVPKSTEIQSYFVTSTWLYKPEYDCWYNTQGCSYPASICFIQNDFEDNNKIN